MRYVVALAAALLGAVAGILPAEARRVALVIGNAEYRIGRLANPLNDAAAVADALEKQLKFDKVLLRKNLGAEAFRAALREMASASRGAELGVVFFAGHGIETGGRNYLIPTDATLAGSADIELETIALDTVLRQLDGVTRLRLVILDACRNNPFPAATRSVRGLGRIEPDLGTLVAYAAKDGTVADDGKSRHSPFTTALLKRVATPALDVRRVFGYVSEDVMAATSRKQEPYLYGRLGGDEVYLNPQALAGPPTVPPQPSEAAETARICREVESMSNLGTLAVLDRQHKGRPVGECVAARMEEVKRLEKQQTALAAPPKPAPTQQTGPELVPFNPKRAATPLTAAEERALKRKDSFRECAECPEMVVVPAGSFTMGSPTWDAERDPVYKGSEGPQHRVTIARPFAVGKFEVTFAEWDACVSAGGCTHNPYDGPHDQARWGRGQRPVMNVSWDDVTGEYLPWLSRRTGKTYRLLTEAEWEYAARAGSSTRFAFGNTINRSHAQYSESGYRSAGMTVPVGSFPPNAFGLHDMHGNLWEWGQDCWTGSYNGAPVDGSAWMSGECGFRVVRGGSWALYTNGLRSAIRGRDDARVRYDQVGFRVARTL